MNIRNLIVGLVLAALFACSKPRVKSYNEGFHIVPQPNSLVAHEGKFVLTNNTYFVADDASKRVVDFFRLKMQSSTGYAFEYSQEVTGNGNVLVSVNSELPLNDEGYRLFVSSQGVSIEGKTERGVFYGLQTLLQLLPAEIESSVQVNEIAWEVPFVEIEDEPRFKWRGMHLDVCRHFIPVENIKKHLDMMAMYKLNTFHWHLTEDQGWRIEIKKYPLLTEIGSKRTEGEGNEVGGFYTQKEVKEIVAYAAERMIDVVPEIELPGHALAALTAYPEYSCTGGPFKVRNVWGVEPDVYCAGKEETFAFLEDIIDEVVELFPSTYFHIGGDECPKERWKECSLCQKRIKQEGLNDEHELQSYFIKRIEKLLLAHGKKMIGWDEILEGGLAQSAAVMSWRGEEGGVEAASQGHDVVMTPVGWCYLDFYQGSHKVEPVAIGGYTTLEKCYGYEPIPKELDRSMSDHVLGTQGNVWTEYMFTPEIVEHRVYPRIIALAEVNWTQKEFKDFSFFLNRLDNQFVRMDLHNINYHIPQPEGPLNYMEFDDSLLLEFTTTRPMEMYYTTDGTDPGLNSILYTEPFTVYETTNIKIRTALSTGKLGRVRKINAVKSKFKPSIDVKAENKGLQVELAKGTFHSLEDLNDITNWEVITVSDYEEANKLFDAKKANNAAVFKGYLNITEDGVYAFSSNMDALYIGERLLISNDGEVKKYSRNDASIALKKGLHPVKMVFINAIQGGWPQAFNGVRIYYKRSGDKDFTSLQPENFRY